MLHIDTLIVVEKMHFLNEKKIKNGKINELKYIICNIKIKL